jgi:DNA invertase Pin-like site-specific DNA recombinase
VKKYGLGKQMKKISSNKEAVLYARVSSKEQEKEGFSIPAQLKLLKEYAAKNGFHIAKEFIDVETAKKSGRANFEKMVVYLKSESNVKIIQVEKTDRLYRNFRDYVTLEELDAEIHLVKENEIISKESRSHAKFIHGIKVLMAKNYIDNLSEEVKKGMREKAEQGDYPSRAPLGYRNDLWYASGEFSLKTVADKAYKDGLGYRKSRQQFSPGSMEKILANPIYYGYFRWEGKLWKGNHEPIIAKELFDAVQAHLRRLDKPKERTHRFAFRRAAIADAPSPRKFIRGSISIIDAQAAKENASNRIFGRKMSL